MKNKHPWPRENLTHLEMSNIRYGEESIVLVPEMHHLQCFSLTASSDREPNRPELVQRKRGDLDARVLQRRLGRHLLHRPQWIPGRAGEGAGAEYCPSSRRGVDCSRRRGESRRKEWEGTGSSNIFPQMIRRRRYEKLPIQANFYPLPSMGYVQDKSTRYCSRSCSHSCSCSCSCSRPSPSPPLPL